MAFPPKVTKAIAKAAKAEGLPEKALEAVVQVESGGKAFANVDGRKLPLILYEYHVFHRNLPTGLRAEAVRRGLASPRWGELPYKKSQKARYAQLERAKGIHEEAAYMACSWGVGQVLGENWEWLGYPSARALAERAMDSIEGQLELMLKFIDKRGLRDELIARDWRGFARLYNGSGQVDFYSGRMAAAYRNLGGETVEGAVDADDDVTLRVGAKGDAVSRLQQNLRGLGHHLMVDGDFGPATKKAVIAFQIAQGLGADGVVGPKTWARIEALKGRDVLEHL